MNNNKLTIDLDFTIKEAFDFIKTTRGLSNKKIKSINNKLLDMLYKIEFCNSSIELENKIIVGDACFLFKDSKDELLKEIEVVPGKYDYNINLLKDSINRPRNIVILLENETYNNLDFKYIGNVFVGSGSLCVFNNSFYKEMNSLYEEDEDTIYISDLYIESQYRANGFATKLLNKLISKYPKKKIKLICLVKNTLAYNFYIKYGFKIIETLKGKKYKINSYIMGYNI